MKCKIIKPLLGLKCNIYDSVLKRKLEILMLLSLQIISKVQIKKQKNQNFSLTVEVFLIFLTSLIILYTISNVPLRTIQVIKLHEKQEMWVNILRHVELNSTTQSSCKIWIFWSSNMLLISNLHCSALEYTKGWKDLLTVKVLCPDSSN